MARGNMILTLVAQTKNFSKGLQSAGKSVLTFGSLMKSGMSLAMTAIGGLATALFTLLPNLVRLAEDSRKSELRLANIAKQMGLFGDNTENVTKRISKYAEAISFATGVDDELVRGAEAILMTFKGIAQTAGKVGGAFDRATIAAVDLAAAGFGDVEANAIQLGKALQDPVKGLTALRRSGVTFTKGEQDKIKALVEGNNLLGAQEIILKAIETQVGGTAEATASSMDKMQARFEAIGEQLGGALLPAVDSLATQMGDWLDSVEGKRAIEDLTTQLEDFGAWITSPDGKKAVDDFVDSMVALAGAAVAVGQGFQAVYTAFKAIGDWFNTPSGKAFVKYFGNGSSPNFDLPGNPLNIGPSKPSGPSTPADRNPGITVNVKGITPSATVGKTVLDAVKNAQRLGSR